MDLTPSDTPTVEPPDWCLVGNLVDEHKFGESQEVRLGSKHFTPGTKVYCLPAQWGDGFERAIVVGRCRVSKRWITVVMRTELITNWRAKAVYHPAVLARLRGGTRGQWGSREIVESWASYLHQREKSSGTDHHNALPEN